MSSLRQKFVQIRPFAQVLLISVLMIWAFVWILALRFSSYSEILARSNQIAELQGELEESSAHLKDAEIKLSETKTAFAEQNFVKPYSEGEVLAWLREDLSAQKLQILAFNQDKEKVNQTPSKSKDLNLLRGVIELEGNFADFLFWVASLENRRIPFYVKSFQASSSEGTKHRGNKPLIWRNKVWVEWYE